MTKTEAINSIVENIAKAINVRIRRDLYSRPFKEILDSGQICVLIRYFDTFAKMNVCEDDSVDLLVTF